MADLKGLINQLIPKSGSIPIDLDDFTPAVLSAYANQSDTFWKDLLDYMQNENLDTELSHYLMRQSDVEGQSTLFEAIQRLADLSDSAFSTYYNEQRVALLNNYSFSKHHWNESVAELIKYLIEHYDIDYITQKEDQNYSESNDGASAPNGAITTGGVKFRIKDVRNADAGRQFTTSANGRWVRQWYNIDGDSYGKVRGSDKILSVLGDKKHLQFTRAKSADGAMDNKWIRLLMPAYTRKVEIEDLNRNFWVIAQTLTAVCAYVFDENNPQITILKKIIDEITQLWENILFLWAAIMLISQKPYITKIHTEVVVLPNDMYRPYRKFDDFDESSMLLSQAWARLKYLADEYKDCHLVILPIVRSNNYRHNFYSAEIYPGVILYNRNDALANENYEPVYINLSTPGNIINIADYINEIGALSFSEYDDEELYFAPYSGIESYQEQSGDAHTYFGMLRLIPEVNAEFTSEGKLRLNSVVINMYDVSRDVRGLSNHMYNFTLTGPFETTTTTSMARTGGISIISTANPETFTANKGFYLGELLSASSSTIEPEPIIVDYDAKVASVLFAPIGDLQNDSNFSNGEGHGGRFDRWGSGVSTSIRVANEDLLAAYMNKQLAEHTYDSGDIILLMGYRQADLFSAKATREAYLEASTEEEYKELRGTWIAGYWLKRGGTIVQTNTNYYEGHNFLIESNQRRDTGYLYYENPTALNSQVYYNKPLKSDRARQKYYNGVILRIPGLDVYTYPYFELKSMLLPLKGEYSWNPNTDYAEKFILQGDIHSGRREYHHTEYLVYTANGDDIDTNNWIILAIHTFGTYSPLNITNASSNCVTANSEITYDSDNNPHYAYVTRNYYSLFEPPLAGASEGRVWQGLRYKISDSGVVNTNGQWSETGYNNGSSITWTAWQNEYEATIGSGNYVLKSTAPTLDFYHYPINGVSR